MTYWRVSLSYFGSHLTPNHYLHPSLSLQQLSAEHELEPLDSDSESEPNVGLILLFSEVWLRAVPALSLSPEDPLDPVKDMVHQRQEFHPSEFMEPISGPSKNWTGHQIIEESAAGMWISSERISWGNCVAHLEGSISYFTLHGQDGSQHLGNI